MKDYDFKRIEAEEFEELSRQLLNKYFDKKYPGKLINLFSTIKGKDAGVDLFYSTPKHDYEIVVQVKHFARSKVRNLFHSLFGSKKDNDQSELGKVKKIKPSRYVIVTSLNISIPDKQRIKKLFSPYIHELSDIFDCKSLNNLLDNYPEIEENFPTLYFTSAQVMRQVISGIKIGHKEFYKDNIESKIKLYVDYGLLKKAETKLREKRTLIITGEPGSGKTTLAEILVYKYLKKIKPKYKLAYILGDIMQAYQLWDDDFQIFYFDDFLGQNFFETQFAPNENRPLHDFIKKVENSKNKLFVLTTRTVIYNHARDNSEIFRRIRNTSENLKIEINKLTKDVKIKMVTKHLKYKKMPLELKNEFDSFHVELIAGHPNFYPRLIDFITDELSVSFVQREKMPLLRYAYLTLENPEEIWRLCYEKQINEPERIFINTLFSIDNYVPEKQLKDAFDKRIGEEYHTNRNLNFKWTSYEDCFQSLNEAFTVIVFDSFGDKYVSFINPSLVDFLLIYLKNYKLEITAILQSSIFIEQLFFRFRSESDPSNTKHIKTIFSNYFYPLLVNNDREYDSIKKYESEFEKINHINLYRVILLILHFRKEKGLENIIAAILDDVCFKSIKNLHLITTVDLLNYLNKKESLKLIIINKWDDLIYSLLNKCSDLNDLDNIYSLFNNYNISIDSFLIRNNNERKIKKIIDEYREFDVNEEIEELIDRCKEYSIVENSRNKLAMIIIEDYRKYKLNMTNIEILSWDSVSWDEIIEKNIKEAYDREIESKIFSEDYLNYLDDLDNDGDDNDDDSLFDNN